MARESGLTPSAAAVLEAVRPRLPEGRVVVALSGGADSAVAAWAVGEIALNESVRAVHVHHGQQASDELAVAAADVACVLGIELTVVRVEVPEGASFEGKAREVRLDALADAAEPGEWLVTGHNADDSAETVFANLLRGAGATGLSGIPELRGRWVRPLLDIDRATIRSAAEDLDLPYLDDPANFDPRHRRTVIRSEVLPWVEERLDVPLRSVLARSAALLAVDDAELEAAAAAVPICARAGAISVPAVVLSTLTPALAARVARRALRAAHPPYPGSAADVAAVLRAAESLDTVENLSGGFRAAREGPLVSIFDREPAPIDPLPLAAGRSAEFGWWKVTAMVRSAARPPMIGRVRAYVVPDALGDDAVVRASGHGERVDIGDGSKPVREAMAEAGVPARLRSAWPVVATGGKIAWVAGVRVAAWARIEPGAGPAVELSVEGNGV